MGRKQVASEAKVKEGLAAQQVAVLWEHLAPAAAARTGRGEPGYPSVLALGAGGAAGEAALEALSAPFHRLSDRPLIEQLQQAWLRAGQVSARAQHVSPVSVAAVLHEGRIFLAQGAGSRAYLWRDDRLFRLTQELPAEQPGFYRPVISQSGDKLLLLTGAESDPFPAEAALLRLVQKGKWGTAQPLPGSLSLVIASIKDEALPAPGGARWQVAVRLALVLLAVLQLAALVALRWLQ